MIVFANTMFSNVYCYGSIFTISCSNHGFDKVNRERRKVARHRDVYRSMRHASIQILETRGC